MAIMWATILTAAYTAAATLLSLRIFNLVQLEGYRMVFGEKQKHIVGSCITLAVYGLAINYVFYLVAVLTQLPWFQAPAPILVLGGAMYAYFDERSKCKRQPLVFTARAKRLTATAAALLVVSFALTAAAGACVSIDDVRLYDAFLPFVFAALPWLCEAALKITLPLEKRRNNKYIEACKTALAAKDGLLRVGITGSFAKTGVKLMLTAMLAKRYKTYCTPSNFNTPLGVCRACAAMPSDCEIFVVEMGARRRGDIKELCEIVKPNVGVLTGIAPQHIETFGTIQNVMDTKYELIEALNEGDFAVFNCESDGSAQLFDKCKLEKIGVSAEDYVIKSVGPEGSVFDLKLGGELYECHSELIGRHNITNLAVAAAAAYRLGVSPKDIAEAVTEIKSIEHRLQVTRLRNGVTLIDDTYNGNVDGARLALDALGMFEGRKIVASQGLVELGNEQKKQNFLLGERIAAVADAVVLIGSNAEDIRLGMISGDFCGDSIYTAADLEEGQSIFTQILRGGDVLLLQNDLTDNFL